jgi:signal transduction histidine kinase
VNPIQGTESGRLSEQYPPTIVDHLELALAQRTLELADSKSVLRQAIAERKSAEAALKLSKRVSRQVLKEARITEERLKEEVHKVLTEMEADRKNMSSRLHDEIVQTLLGIQFRMLVLSKTAACKASRTKEIVTIQWMLRQSVRSIKRLAGEFGMRQE